MTGTPKRIAMDTTSHRMIANSTRAKRNFFGSSDKLRILRTVKMYVIKTKNTEIQKLGRIPGVGLDKINTSQGKPAGHCIHASKPVKIKADIGGKKI